MIKKGDIIENPITGEKMEFLQTAEDTGGSLLKIMLTVKPNGFVAAPHIHPMQEERFLVKSGTIRLQTGGTESLLRANQEGLVPPGVPHVWWNGGADELKAIVEFRPALRTQDFLSTLFALARDGKTDKKGLPNLLQIAVIYRRFGSLIFLAKPPIPIQKLLFSSIAWIGLLLGYQADYPYQSQQQVKETKPVDSEMLSGTIDGR
jgi:mannose-6-phosphate isomerase-like protein (cupin superfamily)